MLKSARLTVLSGLFTASLGLLAVPVHAQDYLAFQSPTGNIRCAIFAGEAAGARCDMVELTPSFTQPPADCELDWGASFGVDPEGAQGYLACVGDTVADPAAMVLDYEQNVSLAGITCLSQKTGMTCTNAKGHGFSISRAKQTVY